jgi:hypothetical protein
MIRSNNKKLKIILFTCIIIPLSLIFGFPKTTSVIIMSPNGGEIWQGGSNKTISWSVSDTDFSRSMLLYSNNSGLSFPDTIAQNISPAETSYNWTVPITNNSTSRVMILLIDSNSIIIGQDTSDTDFTIDSESPSIPNLIAPPNNSYTQISQPRFWWYSAFDNLSGIDYYMLQYSTDSNFVTSVTITTDDTTYQMSDPLQDSVYFWRVKAFDYASNQSNYSLTWRFEIDTRPPSTPILLQPLSNTWQKDTIITFSWSFVTEVYNKTTTNKHLSGFVTPVRYIFQIDTNRFFQNPIVYLDVITPTCTVNLKENKYFWRVRAYDMTGNQGIFSNPDSFGIDTTRPNIPATISPNNGAMTNNTNVTFIWNRSEDNLSGVTAYIIQYSNNAVFTNPTDTIISDTTINLRVVDTTCYWHIKSIDRAGNQSNWSLTKYFIIDTIPPATPILISPVLGIWLPYSFIIFNWLQVTHDEQSPIQYVLQVDTARNFSRPLIIDTTNFFYDTIFLNQARYYWRVKAYDLAGNQGIFSSPDSFGIDIITPTVPDLVSPTNSAMINTRNVVFIWRRSSDNFSGVIRYIIEYAANDEFIQSRDTVVFDTTVTITLVDSTYYWRVKSEDRAGNQSFFSAVRNFELDTRVPIRPTLISPVNAVWLTNTTVIFNWSEVTFNTKSPIRFTVQIDTSINFTNPRILTTSYCCDTSTLSQYRYYWRVRAYDLAGNQGEFSNTDSFGIDIGSPSTPSLVIPTSGATINDSIVTFIWLRSSDNFSGVRNYRIQVAYHFSFENPVLDTFASDTVMNRIFRDTSYYWKGKTIDRAGNESGWSNFRRFTVRRVGIYENNSPNLFPTEIINLFQSNPTENHPIKIAFTITKVTQINLQIYDITGRSVATLVNAQLRPGFYSFTWDGKDTQLRSVADGIYFCTLITPERKYTKKIILAR